jgi:hypothetical protein
MKKFMNLPFGDEIVERELKDYRWEIVIVHFENDIERFRCMKVKDNGIIVQESTHNTREEAEAFIEKR